MPGMPKLTSSKALKDATTSLLEKIETSGAAYLGVSGGIDALTIFGPIAHGVDARVRWAIEGLQDRREELLILLETPGGSMDVAERIVNTVRQFYKTVRFLVPDRAMSAGTILALSGDAILMDYYSCLGPIDPQLERLTENGDSRFVPVLGYLEQYDRLNEKAAKGTFTQADAILLSKLDLAELQAYELERDRSIELVQAWLVDYKFAGWDRTPEQKKERAKEIGRKLNSMKRWGAHSRGINKKMVEEIGLRIDDYSVDTPFRDSVLSYYWMLVDQQQQSFVHSRSFI